MNIFIRLAGWWILLAATIAINCGIAAAQPPKWSLEKQDKQLLLLLEAKKFVQLDSYLEGVVQRYKQDVQTEWDAIRAFQTFSRARPELESLLTGWIAARPNSSSAYLARGAYYSRLGWGNRGKRFANQTTDQQFSKMRLFFSKAQLDFDKAIALEPEFPFAFCYTIEQMMANGAPQTAIRNVRDTALQSNPYSVSVRWYFITTLIPKWGGSMREVEVEIADARRHYDKNQNLKVLEGRLPEEMGGSAVRAGNYALAVEFYTEALRHGWFPHYLMLRGDTYIRLGRSDLGEEDLRQAVQLRPNYPAAYYALGFSHYKRAFNSNDVEEGLKLLSLAVEYLTKTVDADPYDHKALDIRGDAYFYLSQLDLALADFERALALDPTNGEYQQDVLKAKAAIAEARAK